MLAVKSEYNNYQIQLWARYQRLLTEVNKYQEMLHYYATDGEALSEELFRYASEALKNGDIDFLQYVQLLQNASTIRMNYLENLNLYNQTVLEINYISY